MGREGTERGEEKTRSSGEGDWSEVHTRGGRGYRHTGERQKECMKMGFGSGGRGGGEDGVRCHVGGRNGLSFFFWKRMGETKGTG